MARSGYVGFTDNKTVVVTNPEMPVGIQGHFLYEIMGERFERRGCLAVEILSCSVFAVIESNAVIAGSNPEISIAVRYGSGHEFIAE